VSAQTGQFLRRSVRDGWFIRAENLSDGPHGYWTRHGSTSGDRGGEQLFANKIVVFFGEKQKKISRAMIVFMSWRLSALPQRGCLLIS